MTATGADRVFSAALRINGNDAGDLYSCIESLTVTEDLERGSSFSIRLALDREDDGSWAALEDADLRPWNRITILAAFPDHSDVIMDGYITHVNPRGGGADDPVTVEVAGADASYAMNLEERCVVWSAEELGGVEPTFEEIARTIIESYQLEAVLPETVNAGATAKDLPSVCQRGSDLKFLRELARRAGYEFYVRGGEAHFHPPDLGGEPQRLIAYRFGDETNCQSLAIEVDGTRPTVASMSRINPLSGEVETVEIEGSDLEALGSEDLSQLRGYGVPQTRTIVRGQGAASLGQMEQFVQGMLRRQNWWVKAIGNLDGVNYGHVLRSHSLVTIKGFGETYNGNYYVRRVTHQLAPRTYTMEFEAVRNRLVQLGSEDFAGNGSATLPLAVSADGNTDTVTVREDGGQVAPA